MYMFLFLLRLFRLQRYQFDHCKILQMNQIGHTVIIRGHGLSCFRALPALENKKNASKQHSTHYQRILHFLSITLLLEPND